MRRKIIDEYRFYYLNELFDIKLIFLRSQSYIAICMDARYKSLLTIFSL